MVVNSNGKTVLAPWSSIALNRTTTKFAYTFNGNLSRFQNQPAFDPNSIDWSSSNWNQSIISYWGSSGVGAVGTSVPTTGGTLVPGATSVPATGGSSSGALGTSTPMASSSVPSTGSTVAQNPVAILASQLTNVQVSVPQSGTVPSTGGVGTPAPTASGSSSIPSTGSTAAGQVGSIQDAIVYTVSGSISYYLVSAANIPTTGGPSSPAATPSGTSVPNTGQSSVIAVPSRLLRFVGTNSAMLPVSSIFLQSAPRFDMNNLPVLNFGWDGGLLNFWSGGSTFGGTSGGTTSSGTIVGSGSGNIPSTGGALTPAPSATP
jgi:chitinase